MQTVAFSTLALTVALAVTRPRLGATGLRITPGLAALFGVTVFLVAGLLGPHEVVAAAQVQWRPLLSLTAVMVLTGVVKEVGAFERVASLLEARARGRPATAGFGLVFAAGVLTSALLNNDAAILLLTPVVVALTRRLYPGRDDVTVAFAFAVFLAPGVAPFVVSNPMNLIVAEFAGLGFNAYARVMAPIAVAGSVVTYAVARRFFRPVLDGVVASPRPLAPPPRHRAERPAVALLLVVFACYPLLSPLGAPLWAIATTGAVAAAALAVALGATSPRRLAGHVSLDVLCFLWGVFLVVRGLENVGLVDGLAALYGRAEGGARIALVGTTSAVGAALVDNHPMSMLNLLALGPSDRAPLLAALIGADIGPRLLPIGSLAGLLWMEALRRAGVRVRLATFVRLGTLALVPTLALSLVLLWAAAR